MSDKHAPRYRPGDRVVIPRAYARGEIATSVQDPATKKWLYEVVVAGRGRFRRVPEDALLAL